MIIAATLTIPADDTGYSLATLLATANSALLAANAPLNSIPDSHRVAKIQIQADPAETDNVYIVPNPGTLAVTAHVPNNYGVIVSLTGVVYQTFQEETRQNTNTLSLDEFFVAADADNTVFHLWAYTI